MRLILVTILIAAAMAGCQHKQQYRPVSDYPYESDPLGPQAGEQPTGYYDPQPIGPAPVDDVYMQPPAGANVTGSPGISTAEQRRRELAEIEGGSSVAPDPYYAAPGPVAPAPSGQMTEYTVVRGDTLWGISRRFLGKGSRYKEIQAANPGIDPTKLMPGQTLLIPVD